MVRSLYTRCVHYILDVRSLKMNLLNILQPSFEVIAFRFFAEAEGIQSLKFSGHKTNIAYTVDIPIK